MMNMQKICAILENEFVSMFDELRSTLATREDARAFGAMVEARVHDNWNALCAKHNWQAYPRPGRRTIFDVAFSDKTIFYGIDIKTKDLDSQRYSDGGICAVGNLLKFLANDKGIFLLAEFGHSQSSRKNAVRDLEYIKISPFSLLPESAYRIENLGTGQVRLNYTVSQVYDEIEWGRNMSSFFDMFSKIAIQHYKRVGSDAQKRIAALERFRANGYAHFTFAVQ